MFFFQNSAELCQKENKVIVAFGGDKGERSYYCCIISFKEKMCRENPKYSLVNMYC